MRRVTRSVDDCPRLRYLDADGGQQELVLTGAAHRLTVGRAVENDLAVPSDGQVSRVHAVIEWVGGQWTISDDGLSRNGTYVNGERLTGRHRLQAGDSIRIGTTLLAFRDFCPPRTEKTLIADDLPTPGSLSESQRRVLLALCRPFKHGGAFAGPAPNQQIAEELFLSPEAVKSHLRALFGKFGVEDLPHNQKRLRLVERAMQSGVVRERDL
jgi:pSer/pThr/pTyr-binding forkhead associated (FHA) protein